MWGSDGVLNNDIILIFHSELLKVKDSVHLIRHYKPWDKLYTTVATNDADSAVRGSHEVLRE